MCWLSTDRGVVILLLRLFLLFTVVPFVELMLLIRLSQLHGLAVTLTLIIGTGIVGTLLVRWQGFVIMQRIRAEMAQGTPPTDALMDGAMILVAGALLITPGILTDLVGFLLLWPLFRMFIRQALRKSIMKNARYTIHQQYQSGGFQPFDFAFGNSSVEDSPRRVDEAGNEIIDVEFEKKDS